MSIKEEYPRIREWNPRYLAYADANHNLPQEQILIDRQKYPGGYMAGFIIWNRLHWSLFFQSLGLNKNPAVITEDVHKQYNEWLLKYYPHV